MSYTGYDDVNDKVFTSLPCTVASLGSSNGRLVTGDYYAPVLNSAGTATSAYVDPTNSASGSCYNVTGTTTYNDGTGRVVATDDPMGTGAGSSGTGCLVGSVHHTTCTSYAVVTASSVAGLPASDGAPYLQVTSIDANLHQSAAYKDGFGRVAYAQELSGASQTAFGSGISSYAVTSYQYDPMGKTRTITDTLGNVTRWSYDAAGRETGLVDPDRGTWAYGYDANGNQTSAQNTQASAYTTYAGYDGLNRPLWQSTQSSGSSPYAQWSYDSGSNGVGHVSGEQFNQSGTVGKGSYTYSYDARERTTQVAIALDGASFQPFIYGYSDANQQTSLTYPDGSVLAYSYNAGGKLDSAAVTLPGQQQATTLASGLSYSGSAGAAGDVTGAVMGGGMYTYAASYDGDLRLSGSSMTLTSTGTTLFGSTRGYDGAGNVTSVQTTLAGSGTDNQAFCYDEQNRLVWATSQTASGPNGCASNTAGSLTSAAYTQPFGYDVLDRLSSNDVGSYSYGPGLQAPTSPAPLHAAIGLSGRDYTASYDAAGNMVCRAPNSLTACVSGQQQTGNQLSYDAAGQLASWQDVPGSSPNVAVTYAYDGEGSRVAAQEVAYGSGWTTAYLLGDTAETVEGSGEFTDYLTVPGVGTAEVTNTPSNPTVSYLVDDGLQSVSVALDSLGNVLGQALYFPYGIGRYVSGTFPTTHGFAGQNEDGNTTGLFYDQARYYDPAIGQFAQADTDDAGGLNRFAYVAGNPETRTDPTGHLVTLMGGSGGGGNGGIPASTSRPNYAGDYTMWYWHDQNAGKGRFYNLDSKPSPSSHIEIVDGTILAKYFGLSVYRVPTQGSDNTADYIVAIDFGAVSDPGLGADYVGPQYQTAIDLYTPTKSDWLPSAGAISRGTEVSDGIVGVTYKKGQKQASIVAVDISTIDPNGKLSPAQLASYGWLAMNWPYGGPRSQPSQVMRVIFIRNGQVIEDYNPTQGPQMIGPYQVPPPEGGWGPPAAKDMPPNMGLAPPML